MNKNSKQLKINFLIAVLTVLIPMLSNAQAPNPVLVGYFQNWQDINAPYLQLDQVDMRYNLIDVAFATAATSTTYKMEFAPDQVTQATFISQMRTVQGQGRKVLISMGGATSAVTLHKVAERDTFVNTMTDILDTFGFDGIDLDFEGTSLNFSGGTIATPTDSGIVNLIAAVKQIMVNYNAYFHRKMLLTMAPETAGVQGGQSAYGGIWGDYLAVINALRDSLDILHVQLYNSGSMYGIDHNIYTQGTADFIVAMSEATIQGFSTSGGMFNGLPASKIAVGLPACTSAAGGGYVVPDTIKAAINYLMGKGPKPGSYTLFNTSGYPTLRGMMTWSINWDSAISCSGHNQYAQTYQDIFGSATSAGDGIAGGNTLSVYPNPTKDKIVISWPQTRQMASSLSVMIYNTLGEVVYTKTNIHSEETIDISNLPSGLYCLSVGSERKLIVKE